MKRTFGVHFFWLSQFVSRCPISTMLNRTPTVAPASGSLRSIFCDSLMVSAMLFLLYLFGFVVVGVSSSNAGDLT